MTTSHKTSWTRGISLAYEAGGPDVDIQPHIVRMRKLLETYCKGPYSDEVQGFALVLRIDGCIKTYGCEGVDRIRRRKQDKYITADICIPEKRWKRVSAAEFSRYLSSAVKSALEVCGNYLRRHKVDVDVERLLLDYGEAEAKLLGTYQ